MYAGTLVTVHLNYHLVVSLHVHLAPAGPADTPDLDRYNSVRTVQVP